VGDMSEIWERGEHPSQAEVHEPVEPEFTLDEYGDSEFVVRISTRMSVGIPTVDEIRRVLYQGIDIIDSEEAVDVERA
jgi:hypothetical protein